MTSPSTCATTQHRFPDVARTPRRAAHLGLAEPLHGDLLHCGCLLPNKTVDDFLLVELQSPDGNGPEEEKREDRDAGKDEELRPQRRRHTEPNQNADDERADGKEADVKRGARELQREQSEADQNPDPPGHVVCAGG